jgi:CRP/FNR family transcriptional regulator
MITPISLFNASCTECGLKKLCFPLGLDKAEVLRLDAIVKRKSPLQKGEALFRTGQAFQAVYAVRAGGFKVSTVSASGEDQIAGFYLPGDILGADALSSGLHVSTAVAIDTTTVCEVPFHDLERLASQVPSLNHQLLSLMSKELTDERMHAELLSRKSAEERLALFVLWLSRRQERRGFSARAFRLGLLHRDVALYLGLTPETVSRILARLAEERVFSWRNKQVDIMDMSALEVLAGEAQNDNDDCQRSQCG